MYRTRRSRRARLRAHLADAVIGVAIGIPVALLLYGLTLWMLA